jgi:hypothetical protein
MEGSDCGLICRVAPTGGGGPGWIKMGKNRDSGIAGGWGRVVQSPRTAEPKMST